MISGEESEGAYSQNVETSWTAPGWDCQRLVGLTVGWICNRRGGLTAIASVAWLLSSRASPVTDAAAESVSWRHDGTVTFHVSPSEPREGNVTGNWRRPISRPSARSTHATDPSRTAEEPVLRTVIPSVAIWPARGATGEHRMSELARVRSGFATAVVCREIGRAHV